MSVNGTPTILLTGGTSGIGLVCCENFLSEGCRVLVVGRKFHQLKELESKYGKRLASYHCDLSLSDEVTALFPRLQADGESIDHWVHAAGIIEHGAWDEFRLESVRLQLEVDLVAPVLLLQAALASMNTPGSVVLFSSTLAVRAIESSPIYSIAKAGLEMAIRSISSLAAGKGLRVNGIRLGPVDTPMLRRPREGSSVMTNEEVSALGKQIPLGRVGSPEDVFPLVKFLLESEWVTGAILDLDGGQLSMPFT